jgi:hypothetical protein
MNPYSDELRAAFPQLPYSDKMFWIGARESSSFAYERLDLHWRSAQLQFDRIWEAVARERQQRPPEPNLQNFDLLAMSQYTRAVTEGMAAILIEVHFYFVAWRNCYLMLTKLTEDPLFASAKKILSRYQKHFNFYESARHSFEHFDERLPGGEREESARKAGGGSAALFGLRGTSYLHAGKEWDISENSLKLLDSAITEVRDYIHAIIDATNLDRP